MTKPTRARFGYTVFNLTIDEQLELAALAEELGFDAAWFGEHIVLPYGCPSVYSPESDSDLTASAGLPRSIYDENTKLLDLIALAAAVARETRRISIITGVYLAGLRHPLMTARSVATLHELSRGRFQLGVGAGWNQGEYTALGGNFADRGSVLDETIDVLKSAMCGGPFEHHGRHYSFGPVVVSQDAFNVPILFGGHSAPALRRAARMGDGWVSSISNNVDELVQIKSKIDALREEMGSAKRPFDHWIKVNTAERSEIERLRQLGIDRFVLYGDQIWGPGDVSFETRRRRLREVADALAIDQH